MYETVMEWSLTMAVFGMGASVIAVFVGLAQDSGRTIGIGALIFVVCLIGSLTLVERQNRITKRERIEREIAQEVECVQRGGYVFRREDFFQCVDLSVKRN